MLRIKLKNYVSESRAQKANSAFHSLMRKEPYAFMHIDLECSQEEEIPLDERFIAEKNSSFDPYDILFCANFASTLNDIVTMRSPDLIATIDAKDKKNLFLKIIKNRKDISEEPQRKEILINKTSDSESINYLALRATKEIMETRSSFYPDRPEFKIK